MRGIHRRPVNSPHKWPVTRKMFPFDDVIMALKPETNEVAIMTKFGLQYGEIKCLQAQSRIHAHLMWDRIVILWRPGSQALLCHGKHISLILLQAAGVTSVSWFDVKMSDQYRKFHLGLISTMRFPLLVRQHHYIESGPLAIFWPIIYGHGLILIRFVLYLQFIHLVLLYLVLFWSI